MSETPTTPTTSAATIRTWAREQGLAVGQRGALPKSVVEAYAQAHETVDA